MVAEVILKSSGRSTISLAGGNVIDGTEIFQNEEIRNLVELNEVAIYSAVTELSPNSNTIKVNFGLVSPLRQNEDGEITDLNGASDIALGVLSSLRDRFDADNKQGQQEDDGRVIWTGKIYRGESLFYVSVIEKHKPADDTGELPISATAYISASKDRRDSRPDIRNLAPSPPQDVS